MLSLSPGENPEIFTRAETPPARPPPDRRQQIASEAGPFAPSGSPAAHGAAHSAAVPGHEKRRESECFLSLEDWIRSNYLTRLSAT